MTDTSSTRPPLAAAAEPAGAPARRRLPPWLAFGAMALLFAVGLYFALVEPGAAPSPPAAEAPVPAKAGRASVPTAAYVGGAACGSCHAKEHAAWKGSHHDRAMQWRTRQPCWATSTARQFTYAGVTSTFFTRDGRFFVNTDGPDGKLADFEIKYTFGVAPLQQYLVAFPGGRLQALGIAWDTRPKAQGGQRWFHLYPGRSSSPATRCTGPASTRTGTSSAPSATRPTCARTTTRPRTATRPPGPRSTSPARPATGPAPATSPGRSRTPAAGKLAAPARA